MSVRTHIRSLGLVAILACAGFALAVRPASAAARQQGRLTVVQLASPPQTVLAGSAFSLRDTTKNVGRTPTRRTRTIYIAARGRQIGPGAVVLARRWVPPLRPGRSSRGTVVAKLPPRMRTGRYRLLACADSPRLPRPADRSRCRAVGASFSVLPPDPANSALPAVSGTPTDGQTLTAQVGSWRGLPPISYATKWQRCDAGGGGCGEIPAAAAATYTLTPADVGTTIRAAVTAGNQFGSRTVASLPTPPVSVIPPSATAAPSISGTAVSGATVSADPGKWTGTPPIGYAYRWQRCDAAGTTCADIAGATNPTYTVPYSGVGPTLRVAVTGSNSGAATTAVSPGVPEGLWMNPLYPDAPAPDPFVLDQGGKHADYWEFNTGNGFPVLHSSDLVSWQHVRLAMTSRPSWVVQSGDWHPWAPSVLETTQPCPGAASPGCYVMYYVGLNATYGVNCVAVATSQKPAGPYTDRGPLDLVAPAPSAPPVGCSDAAGEGNIDPSPFIDTGGGAYLYVSTDFAKSGGTRTLQPTISVFPLAPSLMNASAARTPLFSGSPGTWEGAGVSPPTVEGPLMQKHGGLYYLLYSGGGWRAAYGMGYATSAGPTGPFAKSASNPIMSEAPNVSSPGGGDVPVTGPNGRTWMLYHGREIDRTRPRLLRMDRFSWQPGSAGGQDAPSIAGPTTTPQAEAP